MAQFEYETVLPAVPASVFEFLRKPANLERIAQPQMGLKFVKAPDQIELGSQLDFQIVSFNQVHAVSHRITDFRNAELIREELIKGPMRSWVHSHRFEPHPDGVRLIDIIEFELPGGLLGLLLSEDKVLDQLEDGFFYRAQQLQRLAQNGSFPAG
jgi:ligand-binding SRPBCC domain-containing protein